MKKDMRRRRRNYPGRKGLGKEKITMLAGSVLVLGALTFTGIYMGQKNKAEGESNLIDFSAIEEKAAKERAQQESLQQEAAGEADAETEQDVADANRHDMDVDPDIYAQYKAANSADVQNPGLKENHQIPDTDEEDEPEDAEDAEETQKQPTDTTEPDAADEKLSQAEMTGMSEAETQAAASESIISDAAQIDSSIQEAAATLAFDESQALAWPVVGNVLINYSMDGYVYYPTLGQYRYSPALVIGSEAGTKLTAAASGIVSEVAYNEEIGNYVKMLLGDGYELTYGQLANIAVNKGDYVETGALVGEVADPTKYYTLEGSNVYFAMTKDGEPINPLNLLQ